MIENIHRIGRILLAMYTVGVLAAVVIKQPDIPIEVLGVISAPAIGYITLKWTGTKTS